MSKTSTHETNIVCCKKKKHARINFGCTLHSAAFHWEKKKNGELFMNKSIAKSIFAYVKYQNLNDKDVNLLIQCVLTAVGADDSSKICQGGITWQGWTKYFSQSSTRASVLPKLGNAQCKEYPNSVGIIATKWALSFQRTAKCASYTLRYMIFIDYR